jgi:hypothetical protein
VSEYLYTDEKIDRLLVDAFTLNEDAPVDGQQFRAVAMLMHSMRDKYERRLQELMQEQSVVRMDLIDGG